MEREREREGEREREMHADRLRKRQRLGGALVCGIPGVCHARLLEGDASLL